MTTFYRTLHETVANSSRDFYTHYGETRSYAEAHRDMRKINAALSPYKKQRIALYAVKGYNTYCAIFAILMSGNTWVPVNPEIPDARNVDMMRHAEPGLILTDRDVPQLIAELADEIGADVLKLDAVVDGNDGRDFEFKDFDDDDTGIIFFTSGSTGTPKGVPLTHGNFINTVHNVMNALPLEKGEVFGDYHDLGFVLCIPYLFCCVLTESAFAPATESMDRASPIRHLKENMVTVLVTVPSTIARLKRLRGKGIGETSIRILCLAGEPLHLDILDYCFNKMQVENVYDFYGSTEVGCWIFHHPCRPDDLTRYEDVGVVPIGRPLEGNQMRLTEEGELMIAGPQVTPGYLGGIEVEKFIDIEGVRWFCTGDRVIERDGIYLCKGRIDSQIKIDGYRIELMDTEAHLRSIEGVDQAICFVSEISGRKAIVAGLIGEQSYKATEIRDQLKSRLPPYMIPRSVFHVTDVPLNKSGKIDRLAVRTMYEAAREQTGDKAIKS